MEPSEKAHLRLYQAGDKDACMIAFKSNVPKFFTIPEITYFDHWLTKLISTSGTEPDFQAHYFVVILDEKIIGAGGFVHQYSKNETRFVWGFIDSIFHKKGFGKMLFDYRLSKMKTLFPTAVIRLDTSQHCHTFFQKYGFVAEKYTADGYTEGMHRYDMKLEE